MENEIFSISTDGTKTKVVLNGEDISKGINKIRFEHNDFCTGPILMIESEEGTFVLSLKKTPKCLNILKRFLHILGN